MNTVQGSVRLPVERPFSAPRPVSWGGVVGYLRSSIVLRRLVPTWFALALTDVLCTLRLRANRGMMRDALISMDAVVGGLVPDKDLSRLARRQVAAAARGRELVWRPWVHERIPIRSESRVIAARNTGRPIILSFTHIGPLCALAPVSRLFDSITAPIGDWALQAPKKGYEGYYHEQRLTVLRRHFRLVQASGSARHLLRVLQHGGCVGMAMDLPGHRRTGFLGKAVDMTDGTARLAFNTAALVVVVAAAPHGRSWEVQVVDVLDSQDFDDPLALHGRLAAIHGCLILRAPDHFASPFSSQENSWSDVSRYGWFR